MPGRKPTLEYARPHRNPRYRDVTWIAVGIVSALYMAIIFFFCTMLWWGRGSQS